MSLPKKHVAFEDYLIHERDEGKTEFRVVINGVGEHGETKIYIHPLGRDGESRDFLVDADDVTDVTQWLP